MKIGKDKQNIIQCIEQAKQDKSLELEVRITNKISQGIFNDILKRVKGLPFVNYKETTETLDISYIYKGSEREINDHRKNRVSVEGIESIKKYCRTNDINSITKSTIMRKIPIKWINVNDYNIRFNLKNEKILDKTDKFITPVLATWKTLLKTFRYKKRFSFTTDDNLFRFDLTIVKNSKDKKIDDSSNIQRVKKKDIKPYQKRLVIKPKDIDTNFNEWYSSLNSNASVERKGDIYYKSVPTITLQESNTLVNKFNYEVEIEYIGSKEDKDTINEEIFNKMINNIGIVLQCIQKSYYIISNKEKNQVIDEYQMMMGAYKFKGPHNVTLELKHIVPKNYEDYDNVISIRRDYSVTDKADGERNLVIILENGDVYLMNRKNIVKSLGVKIPELKQSIFDGEYLIKDKNKNNINLLMIFDVYFVNNIDVRLRPFNKQKDSKDTVKTRHELMSDRLTNLDIQKNDNNNFELRLKKFYYSDIEIYNPEVNKQISLFENELELLEEGGAKYLQLEENIKILKKDSKIFNETIKVYSKEYEYEIDGLIFTPIFLGVGQSNDNMASPFDGRWYSSYKWKPPEENTIDFKVKIKKDDNNKDLIEYANINGQFKSYKILILCVGYNPMLHRNHNSCRVLNENPIYENTYTNVPFIPTNPYRKESKHAYIQLDTNGVMRTKDKNIITDDSIIECRYDVSKEAGFRWIPMRVRDTNNPNDFTTAKNVWNTIFYPITTDMITTGNMDNLENMDEVYYSKNIKRGNLETKAMNDFHSYVKKNLIKNYSRPGNNLLDISCGRGGDLNHWIDAQLNYIIGADYNRENLDNPDNGACVRILNNQDKTNYLADNTLFIWGDSSKNYINGDAGKDELNKYYLDIIYGNANSKSINNRKLENIYNLGNLEKGFGFDIVSCQFSFHYFFENREKLDGVLSNVSNSLKKGGIYIGTTLDGKKVFDLLKKEKTVMKHKNSQLLWKISRKYDEDTFNDDETCLGYKVDVYMESIGKTNTEYLVNYNYLDKILQEYNLQIKEYIDFSDMFVELNKNKDKYGDSLKMIDELKTYSFLNKCFVIEKI